MWTREGEKHGWMVVLCGRGIWLDPTGPFEYGTLQWYITTFKCLTFVDLHLYPYLIPNRVENIL